MKPQSIAPAKKRTFAPGLLIHIIELNGTADEGLGEESNMSDQTSVKEKRASAGIPAEKFETFLAWLDNGVKSDGRSYLEMRQKLVTYFERKNCIDVDELADETLSRVARRLDEEGKLEAGSPAQFCYIVARYVFLEYLRRPQIRSVQIDENNNEPAAYQPVALGDEDASIKEAMLTCLDSCTGELDPTSGRLIIRYYQGAERVKIENRRAMAREMGITVNALSIRAYRIRERLQNCVKECMKN